MKRTALMGFALLFLCAGYAFAQSKTTAELSGTVKDASAAVVPRAKITVTNTETGLLREVTTDEKGEYRVLLLPPGVYDIKVEREGFATQLQKGVEVTVGQNAVIYYELAVGGIAQLVEVTGEIPVVEVERAHQSNTIEERAIRNLPINRRDYLTFSLLAPGVADSKALADNNNSRVKQTPDSGISFYGSNGRGNSITVDGGEANDAGGGVRPTVSQEAVQEFQINRTNYSAEHGSARGGVINIVTKSGGNNLRGSIFGFFRHQGLDATDPFAVTLQGSRLVRVKPDSTRQQFGGTVGFPMVKDRTFFFASYEQLRRRESNSVPVLTDLAIFQPTPNQEAILNRLPPAQGGPLRTILTAPQSTVELFQRNSGIFPFQTDDYKGLFRIDHRFSDRNQFNLRYNVTKSFETNQNVRALVGFSRGFITDTLDSNALVGWTHSFSPTVINEARYQFNYYNPFTGTNDPFGPELNITGFGFFNRDIFLPSDTFLRRHEIVDNLSISRGSHTLKLGGQILVRNNHSESHTFFSGRFGFGALPGAFLAALVPAALQPAAVQFAAAPLTALQAFNLGLPQSYQAGFGNPVVAATYPLYAGFIQDAWKPSPKLTLNFGLRYEVDTRKKPLPTDMNNVAPRFGFAWDPSNDKKTTIRGGYGIFFAPTDYQIDYVVNALNEVKGVRQIAQVLTTLNPADPLARSGPINIFQTLRRQGVIGVPTPTRSIAAADLAQFGINISHTGPRPPLTALFKNSADFVNSYAQQASFGVEREIVPGFSMAASYIFARAAKITRARDDNLLPAPVCQSAATCPPPPAAPPLGIRYWGATPSNPTGFAFFKQPLLLQDNVYESTANSFYHGLVIEATKRFSRNFSFHGNYTFSKAIDEVLDFNSGFQPNDHTNLRAERALSAFDQRHKVVLFAVLQTPRWEQSSSAAARLFADFVLTPIFRANSARPFNLLSGFEINQDRHSDTDRPIFSGRNTGIGPGFWTFDARLSRRIGLGENRSLELMIEGFNLLNHVNFASVNNTVCSGQLPLPVSACRADLIGVRPRADRRPNEPLGYTSAFEARRVQLGLRINF